LTLSKSAICNATIALIAFVLSGAFPVFNAGDSSSSSSGTGGNLAAEILLLLLYGAVFAVLAFRRHEVWDLLRLHPELGGLLCLTIVSALWADSPGVVFRRSVAVLGTTAFGILLALDLSFEQQLRLVRNVLRAGAVLSIACALIAPDYAVSSDVSGSYWRGVYIHKNVLGGMMALALLVEMSIPAQASKFGNLKRFINGWVLLELFLLVRAHSATALFSFLLAFGIVIACRFSPLPVKATYPLILALTALTLVVLFASILPLIGKSADLTGRLPLWRGVMEMISRRPLLGYGYSGFWGNAATVSHLITDDTFEAYYSHNGYLEVTLSLGSVGLALVLAFMVRGIAASLAFFEAGQETFRFWPLALLTWMVIHNLAECSILWQNSLIWAVAVATVYTLSRARMPVEATSFSPEDLAAPSSMQA
jgi:O-antigen ligase